MWLVIYACIDVCVTVSMKMAEQTANIPSQSSTSASDTQADEELDLLFDPQLQCFYDPRTCKYYKLRM